VLARNLVEFAVLWASNPYLVMSALILDLRVVIAIAMNCDRTLNEV
jgi:hypothetical protein